MADDPIQQALAAIRADLALMNQAFAAHSEQDMEIFEQVNAGIAGLTDWAQAQDRERELRQARQDERDKTLLELAERDAEASEAAARAEEAKRKAVVFYGRLFVIGITAISATAGALKVLEVI